MSIDLLKSRREETVERFQAILLAWIADLEFCEAKGPPPECGRRSLAYPLSSYLADGQEIRHKRGDSVAIGLYSSAADGIVWEGISYLSPSAFAKAHNNRPTNTADGWLECDVEVGGEWKKMNVLKE
jgi:hypothetical protein